jgi:glycosyltransferase involved in cell wall biosynthesis
MITILLSSYNHQHFISEAIQSVLDQTFKDWQLWVLDDCSTDGTLAVVDDYVTRDNRITLFKSKKNSGKSAQLNKRLKQIDTECIAFLDSDDIWEYQKLEEQLDVLDKHPDMGLVFTDGWMLDSRTSSSRQLDNAWKSDLEGKKFSDVHRNPSALQGDMFEDIIQGNFIFYSSCLVKSSYAKEIKFSETINRSMDWLFFVELSKLTNFYYLGIPLARYRVHGDNLQNNVKTSDSKFDAQRYIIRTYKEQISNKALARYYYVMARDGLRNGSKLKAKADAVKALKHNPMGYKSLMTYFQILLLKS